MDGGEGRLMCSGHSASVGGVGARIDVVDELGTSETSGMSVAGFARSEHNQYRPNHPYLVSRSHRQWRSPHYVVQSLHVGESC